MGKRETIGVLLVNIGTPEKPEKIYVRRYLAEFLGDKRIIDSPRWKWMPILHGVILQTRPKKSAELYQSIWLSKGSPLMIHSEGQKAALQKRFVNEKVIVSLAMNYGKPSIQDELEKLRNKEITKLIVLPLFPQYSSTTTKSVWDRVQGAISLHKDMPEFIFIKDFPTQKKYIGALCNQIKESFHNFGEPDVLLLSYHGIPKRYIDEGDDYSFRCDETTNAIKEQFFNIPIISCYQSKFGKEEWIGPSTSEMVVKLAKEGKKHIQILSPAFVSDCLETLEEIENEVRTVFIEAGGESFTYIPALNEEEMFIDCLEEIIRKYI